MPPPFFFMVDFNTHTIDYFEQGCFPRLTERITIPPTYQSTSIPWLLNSNEPISGYGKTKNIERVEKEQVCLAPIRFDNELFE